MITRGKRVEQNLEERESWQRYAQLKEKELDEQRLRTMHLQNDQVQANLYSQNQSSGNLVEYQLELQLDEIFHILSGHEIVTDSYGNQIWAEPKDERQKILSEYGVKQIMGILRMHVNKNTLLSSYTLEEVNNKMRKFAMAFQDLLFNQQEDFFHYPKPEQIFELYKKNQANLSLQYIDDVELYNKCLEWSQVELESKFTNFEMVCTNVIDIVENTYHRCIDGKERKSLREHTNISQIANNPLPVQPGQRR